MMKIVLASRNKKKIHELRGLIKEALNSDVEVLSLDDIGFYGEIEENGKTFEENAYIKALAAAKEKAENCLLSASSINLICSSSVRKRLRLSC